MMYASAATPACDNVCFAGLLGSIFKLLLGWADIPDCFCEVVTSFALLVVTHSALRALASVITQQLKDSGQLSPPAEKAVDADGPDGTRQVAHHAATACCHDHKVHPHPIWACHFLLQVLPVLMFPDRLSLI